MRGCLFFGLVALAACGDDAAAPLPEVTDSTVYVDPRIGTGGLGFAHGSCFVGALVPHGLAKPGPDTSGPFGTVSFQHYSGYFAEDTKIRGFSQLHLHGTGATDYGILSLMPTLAFDASKQKVTDYETPFAKADERAEAGYYGVKLANGIDVELTATQRVAVHRYTMPSAGAVVVDLTKVLEGGMVDAGDITVTPSEISGSLHHKGGMSGGFGGYTLYFAMTSDQPFSATSQWTMGAALSLPAGKTTIAIGLSFVSLDGARANLAAEVPAVDFDAIRSFARDAWRSKLDVVKLSGGTAEERRTFYTSFYHAFMMPTVINDVGGNYRLAYSPDIQNVGGGASMVSDMSLWDTYRTTVPLYSWLAPQSAIDQTSSLYIFSEQLGYYPKWPIAIGESGTMLGASAEIAMADTYVRGKPYGSSWPANILNSMGGGRDKVADYIQYGYVPRGTGTRSASLTVEYAHDDFALAQLTGDAALLERSHSWRNLFDPSVGFVRARNADGSFPTGAFDPTVWTDDFAEADAWQQLFEAGIHDPEGVAMIFGGAEAAVAKLEDFFEKAKSEWENLDPESAGNFPMRFYWAGNEPDINAPFLFAQLGRPDLTQKWSRWAEDTFFSDQPNGVPGNDDGGAMGAWYVFSTLGLYPVAGSEKYVVGAPRFTNARITLPSGHELNIVADDASAKAIYVKSVDLDGVPVAMPYVTQTQLNAASTLHFVMTSKAP